MIIGYYPNNPTNQRWQRTTFREYRRIFDHQTAITYLENEVKQSIQSEMSLILTFPAANTTGFYAGVRFLFAEVEGLAKLYWGRENVQRPRYGGRIYSADDAVRFMRRFGILAPTAGVHYEVFRHGLAHTHMPKFIMKNRRVIGWYLSNVAGITQFGIFIPQFRDHVIDAIDAFIAELRQEQLIGGRNRLNKFLIGYADTATLLTRRSLRPYARNRDFRSI